MVVHYCLAILPGSILPYSQFEHHRAMVGYAMQPSLGADSVNIIMFTFISMGFVKLKIKVTPGIN